MFVKKQKAYTLIELAVIIVIIAVLATMAIPAFSNFGKKQDFNQKAEEIKQLMDQTYLLSRNPEKGALSYELVSDNTGTLSKFVLKKCKADIMADYRCNSNSSEYEVVKTVSLLENQTVQGNNDSYLACSSNPSDGCKSTSISILDSNISSNNTIFYTIGTPFSVSYGFGS